MIINIADPIACWESFPEENKNIFIDCFFEENPLFDYQDMRDYLIDPTEIDDYKTIQIISILKYGLSHLFKGGKS